MTTAVKERPILFSSPMVRAILDGRKTVTRRVVKNQPGWAARFESLGSTWIAYQDDFGRSVGRCPYGSTGSRLWVRETFRFPIQFDDKSPRQIEDQCLDAGYSKPWCPIRFEADGETKIANLLQDFGGVWGGRIRPSIHMPRWASRITLEVESVRVERLQGITSEQAFAEGFEDHVHGHVWQFRQLWDKLNWANNSWDANPWVWVVQFRRVDP